MNLRLLDHGERVRDAVEPDTSGDEVRHGELPTDELPVGERVQRVADLQRRAADDESP
ncbi:hypothetical protein [Dactylosporangium sp. NPDC005555]|uniref:hypothetical protein n=1 Tax=Dactylosporangium sp. NPDC005555 TaxID=3154889 RepID=UPI0033BEB9A8